MEGGIVRVGLIAVIASALIAVFAAALLAVIAAALNAVVAFVTVVGAAVAVAAVAGARGIAHLAFHEANELWGRHVAWKPIHLAEPLLGGMGHSVEERKEQCLVVRDDGCVAQHRGGVVRQRLKALVEGVRLEIGVLS
jgi:hypothetical protein